MCIGVYICIYINLNEMYTVKIKLIKLIKNCKRKQREREREIKIFGGNEKPK